MLDARIIAPRIHFPRDGDATNPSKCPAVRFQRMIVLYVALHWCVDMSVSDPNPSECQKNVGRRPLLSQMVNPVQVGGRTQYIIYEYIEYIK